jgi:glycosyltransferase involved in cell wall biosynthesis
MVQILWFCRTSDSSSLARITDSVVPLLKSNFEITLLSNKTTIKGVKHVLIGADSKSIKYKDFIQNMPGAIKNGNLNDSIIRCINMKYILVQIVDLIYEGNFKYLFICNGIYEIDWFAKILTATSAPYLTNKNNKTTKLVVWAPIDYIPSIEVIRNSLKADIFLTMTPVMLQELSKIKNEYMINTAKFDWVGHGSDICSKLVYTRDDLVLKLNKLRTEKIIICKEPLKASDIIILNANNYGPLTDTKSVVNTSGTRKRLDITLKAFLKVLEVNKSVKLWIHTNLKSFFEMLAIENISLQTFVDNIILSNNKIDSNDLELIYQMSNISIQTSTGEGWSLTNLEAAMYRSLQVVPDFLACGYHFGSKECQRGILIPVTQKIIKNEGDIDVTIGEVSIEDTAAKLLEAIELLDNKEKLDKILTNSYNYASQYTWRTIADKLITILND